MPKCSKRELKVLLTCEHITNFVPKRYQHLFKSKKASRALKTHLGLDLGVKHYYHFLKKNLNCFSQEAKVSRLLIEMNRSLKSKTLFSKYSSRLPASKKQQLIKDYHHPFSQPVLEFCKNNRKNTLLHLSLHTYTRRLANKTRDADIGILYDPQNSLEKSFADILRHVIKEKSTFRVRMNYPYRGSPNTHHTTCLRKKLTRVRYAGLEIEVCNDLLQTKNANQNTKIIGNCIRQAIDQFKFSL